MDWEIACPGPGRLRLGEWLRPQVWRSKRCGLSEVPRQGEADAAYFWRRAGRGTQIGDGKCGRCGGNACRARGMRRSAWEITTRGTKPLERGVQSCADEKSRWLRNRGGISASALEHRCRV